MAATATSSPWVAPASLPHSPEKSPTAYPDRLIRPLPKRRIRSRLSEEQADNIVFPPVVTASSPLFGSPQSQTDRAFGISNFTPDAPSFTNGHDHDHFCDCGETHSATNSEDGDDEDDESDRVPHAQRYSWPERTMKYPRRYETRPPSQVKSPPLNSSTSSADGYESFENTNNKKKRKIPVSGALGQTLSADITSMSIPTQSVDVSAAEDQSTLAAQTSIGSGIGISGPGRGRYSRPAARPLSERRPLATSTNALNTFIGSSNVGSTDKGIISTAIANATETNQMPAPKGQENISLLQRQKPTTAVPQNFTFEYKSASSDKFASTRPSLPPPPLPKSPAILKSPGTAGTKPLPQQQQPPPPPSLAGATQQQQGARSQAAQPAQAGQQVPPKTAKPRRPGQALKMQAVRRKAQQRYENYYNPPKPEDMWICQICEYQSIFGREPSALVREYELRERRERKERERNRKRLEQAKAKGRKGKKGKASQKNSNNQATGSSSATNQRYDPRYDGGQEGDSQGEEFFEDDYEDSLQGPSPPDQELGAYASHEYPPPPNVGPVEDNSAIDPDISKAVNT